jgi:hypothetical protein
MLELALERTPEGDLLAPRLRDAILRLVQNDASPVVRLRLASVLGRLPPDLRWTAAESLAARPENAEDDYIEHLAWYAVEPMLAAPTEFAEKLLRAAKSPLLRELAARRLADPEVVARVVASVEDGVAMADLLRGLEPALRGRRNLTAPAAWKDAQKSVEARGTVEAKELSRKLSYFFGDPGAARDLRAAVVAASIAPDVRERALDTLLQGRDAQVEQLLRPLASAVGPLRGAAIRALAAFDGSEIPGMLIDVYAKLEATEKADAIATLAARPAYALALLDAVEKDRLPRRDPHELHGTAAREVSRRARAAAARRGLGRGANPEPGERGAPAQVSGGIHRGPLEIRGPLPR